MRFGAVAVDEAQGAILAHSVAAGSRNWRKATVLSASDVVEMKAAGLTEVVAAVIEPGDIDENAAATLIATVLSASGIEARAASTGRVNLHAMVSGVLTVDRGSVDAINAVDPAITLATLPEFAAVEAGQMLATVKIIPFAVPGELARRAAEIAARSDVLALHPFRAHRAGLIQTTLPSVKSGVLDKTARLTAERLAASGSTIASERRMHHRVEEVAPAIAELAHDYDIVIVFGASAVSDAADIIPAAIGKAGGQVLRVGMPVDPGNLLVVGRVGRTAIIGAPGCSRSPRPNGFDWVLHRILAGLPVGDAEIARMGVGGLLMEIESRPQPREPKQARAPVVDAVLLAAGRAQRMGGPNKLLAEFSGRPLVRQVADIAAASRARATYAVVGHQESRVVNALDGSGARIVTNPGYATGLSSSLKAGVGALPADAAGVLVMLGDMPGITVSDIDRLLDAFVAAGGNAVVRATHAGKRGNPVILPRSLFPAVATLAGDTGARHIVESGGATVIDVEIGEAASLDVDTQEAVRRAGGVLAG